MLHKIFGSEQTLISLLCIAENRTMIAREEEGGRSDREERRAFDSGMRMRVPPIVGRDAKLARFARREKGSRTHHRVRDDNVGARIFGATGQNILIERSSAVREIIRTYVRREIRSVLSLAGRLIDRGGRLLSLSLAYARASYYSGADNRALSLFRDAQTPARRITGARRNNERSARERERER